MSVLVLGPDKVGKSWFLGSMAKEEPTLLIATLPREVNSFRYQQYSDTVDVLVLDDPNWRPSQGLFEATAYQTFLEVIEELTEDTKYRNVIIDSGTELAEAAWHMALSPWKVSSPAEMEEQQSRWLPYDQLDSLLDQGIKGAISLTKAAARTKNIGISWHTQPPKDDTYEFNASTGKRDRKKESADHAGEGVEYEGKVLPMVRGRFRRRLGQLVDLKVYSMMQSGFVISPTNRFVS